MIIGFAGRARHGKDWTARHAQTLLRDRAVTRGFAVALKERVGRAFPEFRYAIAEKPAWMRGILQAVGNGVRETHPEFWVNTLFRWWERQHHTSTWPCAANDPKVLLVPDVRYLNEVEAIKAQGGKVIKVVRTTETFDDMGAYLGDGAYRAPGVDHNHPSEAGVDEIPDFHFDAIFFARSGETRWLEQRIEERLQEWGLVARNDGGMGDDL